MNRWFNAYSEVPSPAHPSGWVWRRTGRLDDSQNWLPSVGPPIWRKVNWNRCFRLYGVSLRGVSSCSPVLVRG